MSSLRGLATALTLTGKCKDLTIALLLSLSSRTFFPMFIMSLSGHSTPAMLPSVEEDYICRDRFPSPPPNSMTPCYLMQFLLSTHGLHLSTIKAQSLCFPLEAVDSSVPSPPPAVIPLVGTVLATTLTLVLSSLQKQEGSGVVNGALKIGKTLHCPNYTWKSLLVSVCPQLHHWYSMHLLFDQGPCLCLCPVRVNPPPLTAPSSCSPSPQASLQFSSQFTMAKHKAFGNSIVTHNTNCFKIQTKFIVV